MEVTIENNELPGSLAHKGKSSYDNFSTHCCPITDIIDRISDKWSVHAIIVLGQDDKFRFGELKKKIHGISQRMLTVTLKHLEQDGLITRTVYPQIPPKVEYRLTDLGRSLLKELIKLSEWATQNMGHILKSREQHLRKCEPNLMG